MNKGSSETAFNLNTIEYYSTTNKIENRDIIAMSLSQSNDQKCASV